MDRDMDSDLDHPDHRLDSPGGDARASTAGTYVVAPARGGGWEAWAVALMRLLARLGDSAAGCVVVTQPGTPRYVQVMVDHEGAWVEVSSNQFLYGDFRLGASEESLLRALGFREPDAPEHGSPNWWLEQPSFDPITVADLVTHVLVAVAGFDAERAVTVEVFEPVGAGGAHEAA